MKTGYRVIDVMTKRPIVAGVDASVRDVAMLMREKDVGSVLLQDGGEFVGIVTEWDLVRRSMAESLDADTTPITKVMTEGDGMVTASPGMDIFEALQLMREHDVRHLPVIDGGRLVGFATLKDILKVQPQLFELIAEKYDIREAERKPGFAERLDSGECELCGNYSERLREVRGVTSCPDCFQDVE